MVLSRRAGGFGAFLLVAGLLLAACGGATATSAPAGEATPTPAGEATPTPAAEATPTPETGGEATPTPAAAIPSFDLEALAGALPVDSYRTAVLLNGEPQYETVVVTQPTLSKAITIYSDGEVSTRFVIIGTDAWMAEGPDGEFSAVPGGMQFAQTFLAAYDPALMLGAWTSVDWAGTAANIGTEQKNGVQAHHLHIDSTTFLGAAGAMPAGSAIDIWVADAGYLIAWEMSGFEEDANFAIEVTNIDDPANKVEAPS